MPEEPSAPAPASAGESPPGGAGPAPEAEVDAAEAELSAVEQALDRLDRGTYDTCEVCGGTIGDERLAAEPATRTCAEHAR